MQSLTTPEAVETFAEEARRAVYDVIALRRDVRHFRPEHDVAPATLERILAAAHLAPSVGFSQPWGFVVIRDLAQRERIRQSFLSCREAEAIRYPPRRRDAYLAHRLEGILEAPVNVCVAVDLRSRGEAILGTTAQPEAVRASACCAVQNLWLAARAEGVGVGWVSIVEPSVLRAEFALPPGVEPIAYLCVGYPVAFRKRPMLEETRWLSRRPLSDVVHPDGTWSDPTPGEGGVPSVASESPSPSPMVAMRGPEPMASSSRRTTRAQIRQRSLSHQATLTKPVGSLGRLEDVAAWYAAARGTFPPPRLERATLALFAADHGVTAEGVSAYGSRLTAATVANVMAGGAAINALAGVAEVEIRLIDVGIAGDLSAAPTRPRVHLQRAAVRAGTRNLKDAPAMDPEDRDAAIEVGRGVARSAIEGGADLVAIGEIGIGNTTSAAALTCHLLHVEPSSVVGRGTGVSDEVLARKVRVVEDALAFHAARARCPADALACFGGLEIAALVGCILEAAARQIPIVLDGFVTNVAALVAERLEPGIVDVLIASHRSPEPGASQVLAELGLTPLLDLGLRLGEGTGAVACVPLLRAAVAAQLEMATFATAGIVGRPGTDIGSAG